MRRRCGGYSYPAPPATASARTVPPPQPDPDAIPVGFGGVLPAPGTALTLHPGTEFLIPVMADADLSDYVRRSGWTGIPVRVVTDAPADVLSVSGEVSAQGWEDPALLAIRVLEPVEPAGFDETYEVRLETPAEGFPELFGLSFRLEAEPVQVRIADPGPAAVDCDGLSLAATGAVRRGDGGAVGVSWFGDIGSDYRSADLTLRSPIAGAELRLVSDYQPLPYRDFGDAYNLVPVMFAFDLDLEGRLRDSSRPSPSPGLTSSSYAPQLRAAPRSSSTAPPAAAAERAEACRAGNAGLQTGICRPTGRQNPRTTIAVGNALRRVATDFRQLRSRDSCLLEVALQDLIDCFKSRS